MEEEIFDGEEGTETELREPRVYEIGYLLLPSLGADGAVDAIADLKTKLTAMGAEHISEGEVQHIDLAYEMVKIINNQNTFLNTAYFGWVKFAINPESIAALTKTLDNHPDMLRYLLIKTTREDTMVNAKPIASIAASTEQDDAEEEIEGIDVDDILDDIVLSEEE